MRRRVRPALLATAALLSLAACGESPQGSTEGTWVAPGGTPSPSVTTTTTPPPTTPPATAVGQSPAVAKSLAALATRMRTLRDTPDVRDSLTGVATGLKSVRTGTATVRKYAYGSGKSCGSLQQGLAQAAAGQVTVNDAAGRVRAGTLVIRRNADAVTAAAGAVASAVTASKLKLTQLPDVGAAIQEGKDLAAAHVAGAAKAEGTAASGVSTASELVATSRTIRSKVGC